MPSDWHTIGTGDEVVLLPLGEHALPSTRIDLWDQLLAREGVQLFGQLCLVATVRGIRAESGRPFMFDIQTANGSEGSWPADKVIRVEDLAPVGMGVAALEEWLDS